MNRAQVRMHPRCPVCRKRIRDRDKVTRLPRRGWAHLACAQTASQP